MSRFRLFVECACVLLIAGISFAATQGPVPIPEPATEVVDELDARLDESAKPAAETLSYIVQAGEVLIFNLPELVSGRKITSYEIKRAPALSWVVKRSFFWRTLAKDVGEHEILLNAMVNNSAVENVVVEIEIR